MEEDNFQPDFVLSKVEEERLNWELFLSYIGTFEKSYKNIIDSKLEETIASLRENHMESIKKRSNLIQNLVPPKTEEEYIQQKENIYYASLFYTENLKVAFALYELRIMYAYKYFEIKLNHLAADAFQEWNNQFNWEQTVKAFKSKGINLKNLANYKALDEFRRLNNALKHKGKEVDYRIANIDEFRGLKYFEISHLKQFYKRVKDAPYNFISELSTVLYRHLGGEDITEKTLKDFVSFDGKEIDL